MTSLRTLYFPKGSIVIFSEGEYSDYGIAAEVVTLCDLDLHQAFLDWRELLGKDEKGYWKTDGYSFSCDVSPQAFIAHLCATQQMGIIYLTPETLSGSYLLMQRAIPPQPRGGCYAR